MRRNDSVRRFFAHFIRHSLPLLAGIGLLALLQGCSHYPLGMDEETWKRLPQSEKVRLMKLDAQQRQRERLAELEAEKEKARLQAELEREKLRTWQTLFRNLSYGQVIQLSFLNGRLNRKGQPAIVPDSFILPIGASETLKLHTRQGDTFTLWAEYAPGKVVLCSEKPDDEYDRTRRCQTLIDLHWERGQRYSLTLPHPWRSKRSLFSTGTVYVKALPTER